MSTSACASWRPLHALTWSPKARGGTRCHGPHYGNDGRGAPALQGDLDAGRRVVELLTSEEALGDGFLVEDLYCGALAVAQRLERPAA